MDPFALFGERARPWLEEAALKQRFLALSSEQHPDKFQDLDAKREAETRFSTLNQSYNLLRNSRSRILHFLEQQNVPNPARVQDVPAAVIEFFNPIAEQTRRADVLVKQRAAASSPMLKVQLFEQALAATTEIQDLQTLLSARIREIEAEIQALDARWCSTGDVTVFRPLQSAAAALGFLERWNAQLQQRLAALAF